MHTSEEDPERKKMKRSALTSAETETRPSRQPSFSLPLSRDASQIVQRDTPFFGRFRSEFTLRDVRQGGRRVRIRTLTAHGGQCPASKGASLRRRPLARNCHGNENWRCVHRAVSLVRNSFLLLPSRPLFSPPFRITSNSLFFLLHGAKDAAASFHRAP